MIELSVNDRIRVREMRFFNEFKMSLIYDSMASSFSFNFYFDPNNKDHAELACVSHIHECSMKYDGELVLTGYMLSQGFVSAPERQLASIGGYSKPGVLEDCDIPTSNYPLQSDGLTLRQITQKIIAPYDIGLAVSPIAQRDSATIFTSEEKTDKVIEKSTAAESQNIKDYLTTLATQKNIIFSHTPEGKLLITEANTKGAPIFEIGTDKGIPVTTATMTYNGQPMHSQITVIRQTDEDDGNAAEYTIKNPFVPIVFRNKVVVLTSGNDITIQEAARNELGKEIKNIKLVVTIDRWTVNGKLIRPNNTIRVKDRSLFLYEPTLWFIEQIDFTGDASKETAVLTCCPTSAYNNSTPKNYFVDPHKNLPRV